MNEEVAWEGEFGQKPPSDPFDHEAAIGLLLGKQEPGRSVKLKRETQARVDEFLMGPAEFIEGNKSDHRVPNWRRLAKGLDGEDESPDTTTGSTSTVKSDPPPTGGEEDNRNDVPPTKSKLTDALGISIGVDASKPTVDLDLGTPARGRDANDEEEERKRRRKEERGRGREGDPSEGRDKRKGKGQEEDPEEREARRAARREAERQDEIAQRAARVRAAATVEQVVCTQTPDEVAVIILDPAYIGFRDRVLNVFQAIRSGDAGASAQLATLRSEISKHPGSMDAQWAARLKVQQRLNLLIRALEEHMDKHRPNYFQAVYVTPGPYDD